MRELKFRAWDKNQKIMMLPEYSDWEDFMLEPDGTIYKTYETGSWETYRVKKKIDIELMQFTGLKDKNGKEIYEGDIVETEKWIGIGKYARCKGVIVYKTPKYTIDCIGDWEGSDAELNGLATIIGNIYENPELLQS